jgi:hypothetical protein
VIRTAGGQLLRLPSRRGGTGGPHLMLALTYILLYSLPQKIVNLIFPVFTTKQKVF